MSISTTLSIRALVMVMGWLPASADQELRVVGRAVDESGRPIVGLRIELADFQNGEQWSTRPSVFTDDDGRFGLTVHELSWHTIVSGWKDDSTLLWSRVIRWRESGVDDVGDLMIERRPPWLRGRVVDERGDGVEGADVVAFHCAGRVFTKTAADGRFEIGGLFPHDVWVHARNASHRAIRAIPVVDAHGSIESPILVLDVARSPDDDVPRPRYRRPFAEGLDDPTLVAARELGRPIDFVVVSPENEPVPGAAVAIWWSTTPRRELSTTSPTPKFWRLGSVTSDELGRARIEGVPPGHVWIETGARDHPTIFLDLVVAASLGETPVRLAFERGAFIEGFVIEEGRRRDHVDGYRRTGYVEIFGPHTFGSYRVPLEFDGSFRAGPLPSGAYALNYVDELPMRFIEVWEGETRLSDDSNFFPFLPLAEGETCSLELRIVKTLGR